jgi:hypothetical protein
MIPARFKKGSNPLDGGGIPHPTGKSTEEGKRNKLKKHVVLRKRNVFVQKKDIVQEETGPTTTQGQQEKKLS